MKRYDLTVRTYMTPAPHSVDMNQPLSVALNLMEEHGIRHLAVRESKKLAGVISERDIRFALASDKRNSEQLRVVDAYTVEPYVVDIETDLGAVAKKMAKERFGCALVTEKGELAGIFTTVDACAALAEVLSGQHEQ